MNSSEFMSVINRYLAKKHHLKRYRLKDDGDGVFSLNSLTMEFSETGCAIVYNIPYLLAKQFWKKEELENCVRSEELSQYVEQLNNALLSKEITLDSRQKLYDRKRKELLTNHPEKLHISYEYIHTLNRLDNFLKKAIAYFKET